MNYSKQREIVYNTLKENVVHPTAEYVYDVLKKDNPNISLATVYRNLNQLAKLGKIKKIEGLEQSVHYDHNTHEHYHFICDSCKKVYDIDASITFDENTQQEFTIHGYDIAFHGLCKNCQ